MEDLQFAEELRTRTREARNGHWFALLVLGVVVLGSMPFYLSPVPSAQTPGCRSFGPNGFVCSSASTTSSPLGGGLGPMSSWSGLATWTTVYWTASIVCGVLLVLLHYRRRSESIGIRFSLWPFAVAGIGLVALALGLRGRVTVPEIPDFWIRGTQALIVIALGIAVLALVERSRSLGLFAGGFFALALLSCLYDDDNLLQRFGLDAPFRGSAHELPNLLLPGLYLLLGGLAFWIAQRFGVRLKLTLSRSGTSLPVNFSEDVSANIPGNAGSLEDGAAKDD